MTESTYNLNIQGISTIGQIVKEKQEIIYEERSDFLLAVAEEISSLLLSSSMRK